METAITVGLEHAGPIGAALCALAVYLMHRLDMLPTYRGRIAWVAPEPPAAPAVEEQAKQLVQVGQRMQSAEGKERRVLHPIVVHEKRRISVAPPSGNEAA